MKKAVIIYSGGLDSTTLLYDLKAQGYNLHALTFKYGSKHSKQEVRCAKWNTKKLGILHKIINLDFIKDNFKSNLLKSGGKIPTEHYAHENQKKTVVPFRNAIMLSFAVGYAESIGAKKVFLASHKNDRSIYPDCRPKFNRAFGDAAKYGTFIGVKLVAPYENITKVQIIKKGLKLQVPYQNTYSCYNGKEKPCQICGSCRECEAGFKANGMNDPRY